MQHEKSPHNEKQPEPQDVDLTPITNLLEKLRKNPEAEKLLLNAIKKVQQNQT